MNSKKQVVNIQATVLAIVLCILCIHEKANGQDQTGTFKDRDGNTYTFKTMPDNKKWMTANLNINVPGSYGYENAAQRNQYGRLYTWKSAQEACPLLGDGWRLPTHDEWRQLATYYGGYPEDSSESRKKAYKALLSGGSAAFNAVLGGGREVDGAYRRVDAHGFYWTATATDSTNAWFCNFGKGSQSLYRQKDGEKSDAFSVRCIRDTSSVKGK